MSQARIDALIGKRWQSVSPPAPTVSFDYDFIPFKAPVSHSSERSIRIEQSFDFPLSLILQGTAAGSEIDAARSDARSLELALAAEVKQRYFTALAASQRLLLAKEHEAITDTFAWHAEARFNAGEATNLERLTARLQQSQARTEAEIALHEQQKSMNDLQTVFSAHPGDDEGGFSLADSFTFQPFSVTLDSVDKAGILAPDIQAAEKRLRATEIAESLSWLRFLPSMTISYATQRQDGMGGLYGLGFGFSVPLWFLFDQKGHIQESSAIRSISESELAQRKILVQSEIRTGMLDLHIAEHQVTMYRDDILPTAEEAYRSAAIHYNAGEITYIEYLQSKQTLIAARNANVDALLTYNLAKVRLERTLGIIHDESTIR